MQMISAVSHGVNNRLKFQLNERERELEQQRHSKRISDAVCLVKSYRLSCTDAVYMQLLRVLNCNVYASRLLLPRTDVNTI